MEEVITLKDTVASLREPGGCPWDHEQTHQSLAICLVEECSETLEAIDEEDFDSLQEELGDLLLQVVMHACLAEEAGHFANYASAVTVQKRFKTGTATGKEITEFAKKARFICKKEQV